MKIIKVLFVMLFVNGFCNPSGEKIIHGDITLTRDKGSLIISQKSGKAIIDWNDFSISLNETTTFVQPCSSSSVLNRVISSNPSIIFGNLISNGGVYLINQNGILFGKNACIDTNAFIASTLDVANEEFLFAKDLHFSSNSNEKIINKGKIRSHNQDIFLLAKVIENEGTIISENGSVNLIGAMDVLLIEKDTPQIVVQTEGRVKNEGFIEACRVLINAAGGNIYSHAVNQSGIIEANGASIQDGKIILTADEGVISLSSELKANTIHIFADHIHIEDGAILDSSSDFTSEILIGGDFRGENSSIKNAKTVHVYEGSKIIADSFSQDGGNVIIFSEDKTIFEGSISSRALGEFGNGGLVEISSKGSLSSLGDINVRSKNHDNGTVLFDPGKVTIMHGENEDLGFDVFNDGYINELLTLGNVEISTTDSTSIDVPTIVIESDVNIEWNEQNSFILRSDQNILMKQNANISSTCPDEFLAIDFKTVEANGNYTGIKIEEGAVLSAFGGHIILDGAGGNILDNNYGIHLKGRITSFDSSTNGSITLKGKVGRGENNNSAIFIDQGIVISENGPILLDGKSLGTQEANHGIYLDNTSKIQSMRSTIDLMGEGSGTNSNGINIAKGQIRNFSQDGRITFSGKEAGAAAGIYLSANCYVLSNALVEMFAQKSIFSNAQIETGSAYLKIGMENNGSLVLKRNIFSNSTIIEGSDFNDIFYIDCDLEGQVYGSGGNNTLVAKDSANNFQILDLNKGVVNNSIEFNDIQNLKGSLYQDDIFVFQPNGKINGQVESFGGTNTLQVEGENHSFSITGINEGYIENVCSFKSMQNLIGGNGNDIFMFSDGSDITGLINGNLGINQVNYSNYTTPLTIDLHRINNIQEIIGGQNIDLLLGPENQSTWNVTGSNEGSVGNIIFSNIENLVGSDQNDIFNVSEFGKLDGYVDGNGGYNSLFGANSDNKWVITGINSGYIENILIFKNIHNLYGSEKEDVFVFYDEGSIQGTIDGGSNATNVIDYSNYQNQVAIDLNKIENIQNVIGSQSETTLIAKDTENTWLINSLNSGELDHVFTFSNVENIVGGAQVDKFFISENGSLTGYIDGSSGDNSLYAPNLDNTWTINSINSGELNDIVDFKNIKNLIGSEKEDTFIFQNEAVITGSIDGGIGNNVLDFSLQNSSVTIDLNKIDNIQNVIGGQGSDVLIGKDQNNIWEITALNEGNVLGIEFSNIENLKGGALSDIFVFSDSSSLSGSIDGGNQDSNLNLIDYSACSEPVQANLLTGNVSNIQTITNIQAVVLPNLSSNSTNDLPSFIEIPIHSDDPTIDFNNTDFVDDFINNLLKNNDQISIDIIDFPIYVSTANNKVYVYRAKSPFIITSRKTKSFQGQISLSAFLQDMNVADSAIRMKNNLSKAINPKMIARRGDLKKVTAVYKQDEYDGLDTDDFDIQTEALNHRAIKQRPRSLHFTKKEI